MALRMYSPTTQRDAWDSGVYGRAEGPCRAASGTSLAIENEKAELRDMDHLPVERADSLLPAEQSYFTGILDLWTNQLRRLSGAHVMLSLALQNLHAPDPRRIWNLILDSTRSQEVKISRSKMQASTSEDPLLI